MLNKLGKIRDGFNKEVGAALLAETKIEVKECQKESPVDSGDMRDGIHAEGPFFEGTRIYCIITTGPESEAYALIQHEDPDLDHPVGKWHFISDPLRASAPYMGARVAARIDLKRTL